MSNSAASGNPTAANPNTPPAPPAGGNQAAIVALVGTAAVAGAAFLASQYWGEDPIKPISQVIPPVDPPVNPPVNPPVTPPVNPPVTPPVDPPVDPHHDHPKTFDEAFAEARATHLEHYGEGGGGSFVWEGKIYNTYLVEEWHDLSDKDKDEFLVGVYGDDYHPHHLHDLNPTNDDASSQSVVAHNSPAHEVPKAEEVVENNSPSGEVHPVGASISENTSEIHTIEPTSVGGSSTETTSGQHSIEVLNGGSAYGETAEEQSGHPEIHILNTGTIESDTGEAIDYWVTSVDGHHVTYYDLNRDGHADEAFLDTNNDNKAEYHYSFDPTTHEITSIEAVPQTDTDSPIDQMYTDNGTTIEDHQPDYNHDADVNGEWV